MATAYQFSEEEVSSNDKPLLNRRISLSEKLWRELRLPVAVLFFLIAFAAELYALSAFLPLLSGDGSVEWIRLNGIWIAAITLIIAWSLVMYRK